MESQKRIVLIAHDRLKPAMIDWAKNHVERLKHHLLFATGTTGTQVEAALQIPVHKYKSGPLGGDQQIGAKIVEGELDLVIFFWDPLSPQPHDVDVKALLRIAVVYNIPIACNAASADLMIQSL